MTNISHFVFYSVAAVSLIGCNQTSLVENKVQPQRTLQVVQLEQSNISTIKTFTGTVFSHEKAGLAFRVPGTIEKLLINTGDKVTKGQVIAYLDPHDYQVTIEELQARKLEASSAYKLAKSELKRVKQATNDDAIASVNLDRAISGYERALAATKVAGKNIQRANDMLRYTKLTAPFSGEIASVEFDQYEQVLPGVPIATIQNNDDLEVKVDVPENLVGQFKLGLQGSISWYGSKESLKAQVTEIAPVPHLIKQTYSVTYTIDDQTRAVFPGKSVTVNTSIGTLHSDHCVPYSAVIGTKNTLYVNIVEEERIKQVPVELSSLDAYQACIKGDLDKGDYVVVSGSNYLSDGDSANKLIVRTQ